jgi:hypothetical protein
LTLFLPLTEGLDGFALPDTATWSTDHPRGKRGMRFNEDDGLETAFPRLRSDSPLTISFWFRTPDILAGTTVLEQTKKNADDKTVGWKIVTNTANALTFEMHDGTGKSINGNLPDNDALRPRVWQHVCIRYSGGQSTSSISILNDGRQIALRNSSENLIDAVDLSDSELKIASNLSTAALSDIRIFQRWLADEEVTLLAKEQLVLESLVSAKNWAELDSMEQALLDSYYRQTIDENYQTRSRQLAESATRHDYIYSRSTTTLVMEERAETPHAYVLERGEYTKPTERVQPGVPAVFDPLPDDGPSNRLALARWLVSPQHPLVARVMVNRLWQSVFGVGLVKTSEDFGVMGTRPSNPELLDWLAVEFVEAGWDVNHILKLMVTSAAYCQNSVVTPDKLSADPDNRFLSRGPRHRLDAEMVRDEALSVSGLLRRDIGGPSVKPYQPAGLWNVVAITGSNTGTFAADSGDKLYRRSLYTFWKRTSPPPSMAAFNAPTREQCTVRRERTNTPLQALVMMNDVQFVEAAKVLALRTLKASSDDAERARAMFFDVLRRPATESDVEELRSLAKSFKTVFAASPDDAQQLIAVGEVAASNDIEAVELAAWTLVANTLMNRDDFINK